MNTIMYGYDCSWRNARVSGSGFRSRAEMIKSYKRALDSIGYYPPLWYEFWRIGEPKFISDENW